MRININYQADPNRMLGKLSDFLDEKGFPPTIVGVRRGPRRIEYVASPSLENPTRHQVCIFLNPDPSSDFEEYEIFRCVVLSLDNLPDNDLRLAHPVLNVAAYTRFSEYDFLVDELRRTFDDVFPIFTVNTVTGDDDADSPQCELIPPDVQSKPFGDPATEPPTTEYPVPVEDPTDQRILKIVQKEPDLTDAELGRRIGLSRQNTQVRRKTLEKMGYKVR